jgi:hypothetical protein
MFASSVTDHRHRLRCAGARLKGFAANAPSMTTKVRPPALELRGSGRRYNWVMTATAVSRSRAVRATTWVACFGIATVLGLLVAVQRWASFRGPNRPSFWDSQFIEPQLIPWYAWALLAPLVMLVLDRPLAAAPSWRRVVFYLGVAVVAILAHAVVSGFALGWWWSFPSLVPTDPGWHIADQLSTRTSVSLLVVWLIAATWQARSSAAAVPAVPAAAQPSPLVPHQGPLALRTGDRISFVDPADIAWIQADGDYVIVHVGTARHRVRETISAMEKAVPQEQFVRVSRSAIVNLSSVREMQRWFRGNFVIVLRDGTRVTTGARYRDRIARFI